MRLSHRAVLSLLFLAVATPAIANDSTGAALVTSHLVAEARAATDIVPLPVTDSVEVSLSPPAPAASELTLEQIVPLLVTLATSGQWAALMVALVIGAVLVLATTGGVRSFLGRWVPWLKSDRAGVVLSALLGPLGSLLASLTSGVPVSLSMVLGFLSSLIASGLWSWQRKVRVTAATAPYCTADDIANGKAGC